MIALPLPHSRMHKGGIHRTPGIAFKAGGVSCPPIPNSPPPTSPTPQSPKLIATPASPHRFQAGSGSFRLVFGRFSSVFVDFKTRPISPSLYECITWGEPQTHPLSNLFFAPQPLA